MKNRKKRFAMTLIEIMVVIVLIGLVTGALAFNMSGSMDRGRAFKTEQNIGRIKDILFLEMAETDESPAEIAKRWKKVISQSPLVLNEGKELMKDGWSQPILVSVAEQKLVISSAKLDAYKKKHES